MEDSAESLAATAAVRAAAPREKGPEGIGGWLLLPVLHLILALAYFVYGFIKGFASPAGEGARLATGSGTAPPVATASDAAPSLAAAALIAFSLFSIALALYTIYCLVRLFQKKESAPRLMIGFYAMNLVLAVFYYLLLNVYPDLMTDPIGEMGGALKGIFQSAVFAALWISYFRVSVRVENTFTR
jgi:Protein of unknown function (DUF2569)